MPHPALSFAEDDGSVVLGTDLAPLQGMAERSLADRVKMLEDKLGTKTLEEYFREQAELIDRRSDEGFRSQAELIDRRLDEGFRSQAELIDRRLDESFRSQGELIDRRLDESFRSQAELIDRLFLERDKKWDVRFGGLEKDVSALKVDVSTLKKDMTIVREGVGILLKRGG